MKKTPKIITAIMLLLLAACSNTVESVPKAEGNSHEISKVKVKITNDESIAGTQNVKSDDGKKIKITPTVLYYEARLDRDLSEKLLKNTNDVVELKIIPDKELIEASKSAVGFNLFDTNSNDEYGSGQGIELSLDSKAKGRIELNYILGADEKNKDVPLLPNEQKLDVLKDNALKGKLVITKNDKEVARFNLNEIN
ncbi:hypothetical protein [Priestia aryabhattai]